jgi:hypothetical protein
MAVRDDGHVSSFVGNGAVSSVICSKAASR